MSPRRRLTVCAEPGCYEISSNIRCPTHAKEKTRQYDADRPTAAQRGYDAKWQATRKRYLLANPTCQWPGCYQPAVDVDHIDGLGPLAPRGHDPQNLEGFCKPHHTRKTNRYDGGYGNPRKPHDGRPGSQLGGNG